MGSALIKLDKHNFFSTQTSFSFFHRKVSRQGNLR